MLESEFKKNRESIGFVKTAVLLYKLSVGFRIVFLGSETLPEGSVRLLSVANLTAFQGHFQELAGLIP